MKKFIGKDLMHAFGEITPYLSELYMQDISVAVVDQEKFLHYEPAKTFNLDIKVGDLLKEGAGAKKAMNKREKCIAVLDKEIWGVPLKSISIPVFDEVTDKPIGAVAIVISVENNKKFTEIIEQFTNAFEQVNLSAQDISSGALNLAKVGERLSDAIITTKEDVERSDEIIQIIQEIANQTKLLGLNAAIEAARAGDQGRGFAVVAEEIRRLSEQSNTSAKKVKEILNKIIVSINTINNQIQETYAVSQEQSSSTQEIAASMEELTAQLADLKEFTKFI